MPRDRKRLALLGLGLCTLSGLGVGVSISDPGNSEAADQSEVVAPQLIPVPTAPETPSTSSPALEVAGVSTIPQEATTSGEYGCAAALAYLAIHAKPGAVSYCPHDAQGHSAETRLMLTKGVASTDIYIAEPCPNAYRNEASNSWGHWEGKAWIGDFPDDPYGPC